MFSNLIRTAVVVFTMTSSLAFADQMGPNGDKFYEEAAHFENACITEHCQGPYSKKRIYDQKLNINNINVKDRATLKAVAVSQTQIWGDTILEGDYYATGRTRLDNIVAYYKNDSLIGYKIQYSEKAWDISNCQYNGKRDSLKSCIEGRIVEGSYVSADALTYFSDEERYAEFSSSSL